MFRPIPQALTVILAQNHLETGIGVTPHRVSQSCPPNQILCSVQVRFEGIDSSVDCEGEGTVGGGEDNGATAEAQRSTEDDDGDSEETSPVPEKITTRQVLSLGHTLYTLSSVSSIFHTPSKA